MRANFQSFQLFSRPAALVAATLLLSTTAAGVAIYFLSKHFGSIPLLSRLVLADTPDDALASPILAMEPPLNEGIAPGDLGTAESDLRPSGRARINGLMVDAIAERGYIEDGQPVEAVAKRGFSWVVRPQRAQKPADTDSPNSAHDPQEHA